MPTVPKEDPMADQTDPIPEGVTLPDPTRSVETPNIAPVEDIDYSEEADE